MAYVSINEEYDEYNIWENYPPNTGNYDEKFEEINISPEYILNSNTYLLKQRNIKALDKYDYIITYSWDIEDLNWYGAISAWYDAFELWYITTINTLPSDLGGKSIALLIPDCETKEQQTNFLLAITSKYKLDEQIAKRLSQSIYFIYKPNKLILSKGKIPYLHYSPSNLIFIDGKLPKLIRICADNIYLSLIDNLSEESLQYVSYNFLFIYRDKRIFDLSKDKKAYPYVRPISIARANLPNTLIFDDIRRINFGLFKKPEIEKKENGEYDSEIPVKKRILLYMTEKNKRHQIKENSDSWATNHLDDILNALPKQLINPLGLEIAKKQKELYNFYIEVRKNEKFSTEEIIALKEKGTIFGNGYNIDDVIKEDAKVHFIIVGLTDINRGFETALIKRAMEKGINISTEVYLKKDLPIIDIHSKYDIYLFTPMYKWCTSRFIPEAKYYKKKIILTKEAKKTFNWNLPLNIRYNDSEKYLMFISEDDVFKKPKSLLANNILGNW